MLINKQTTCGIIIILFTPFFFTDCAIYYVIMEKIGVHKRDILIDRVEEAKDAQAEAQEEFKSALEQFTSVVGLKGTELKAKYERLDEEYRDCEKSSKEITDRINKVKKVSKDLFKEWKEELKIYQDKRLRASSRERLRKTKCCYLEMLACMHRAECRMKSALEDFRDHVLSLKHNLNAQSISSLDPEFAGLQNDIDSLVKKMKAAIQEMNTSIEKSNEFIAGMENV